MADVFVKVRTSRGYILVSQALLPSSHAETERIYGGYGQPGTVLRNSHLLRLSQQPFAFLNSTNTCPIAVDPYLMLLLDAGTAAPTVFTSGVDCRQINGQGDNLSFGSTDYAQRAAANHSSTDRCESFSYYVDMLCGDDDLGIQC